MVLDVLDRRGHELGRHVRGLSPVARFDNPLSPAMPTSTGHKVAAHVAAASSPDCLQRRTSMESARPRMAAELSPPTSWRYVSCGWSREWRSRRPRSSDNQDRVGSETRSPAGICPAHRVGLETRGAPRWCAVGARRAAGPQRNVPAPSPPRDVVHAAAQAGHLKRPSAPETVRLLRRSLPDDHRHFRQGPASTIDDRADQRDPQAQRHIVNGWSWAAKPVPNRGRSGERGSLDSGGSTRPQLAAKARQNESRERFIACILREENR